MHYHTAKHSHPGGREQQEDSVAVFVTPEGGRALLAVADGMGGHRGGELASQAVIETATQAWGIVQQGIPDPAVFLGELCRQANQAILKIAQDTDLNPHSTCVFLWLDGSRAWWAHVGDSRIYHLRGGAVRFRSKDHSVVQMLVNSGELSEAEMAHHPDQGRLLKGLGDARRAVEPSFGQSEVLPGDGFLLCSDGLWERFTPEEIARALSHAMPLEKIAEQLVKEAARRGGKDSDNVSVALARTVETAPLPGFRRVLWGGVALIWLMVVGLGAWWYLTMLEDRSHESAMIAQPDSSAKTEKTTPPSIPVDSAPVGLQTDDWSGYWFDWPYWPYVMPMQMPETALGDKQP